MIKAFPDAQFVRGASTGGFVPLSQSDQASGAYPIGRGMLFCPAVVASHIFSLPQLRDCDKLPEEIHCTIQEKFRLDSLKERDVYMLEVRVTKYPHTTLLALTGHFDHRSFAGIEIFILGAQNLGYKHVILDFSGVTDIDSISLQHLFDWYHTMKPHRVSLRIVNPHPRIQEVLENSRIAASIPIDSSNLEVVTHNGTLQKR